MGGLNKMNKKEKDKKIEEYYKYLEEKEDVDFLDYWALPIEKDKVFKVLSEEYLNEKVEELEDLELNIQDTFLKLLGEIAFLENDFKENREEIAYVYYLIAYNIIVNLFIPNGLILATYYINKAIDITNIESNKKEWTDFRDCDVFYNY